MNILQLTGNYKGFATNDLGFKFDRIQSTTTDLENCTCLDYYYTCQNFHVIKTFILLVNVLPYLQASNLLHQNCTKTFIFLLLFSVFVMVHNLFFQSFLLSAEI